MLKFSTIQISHKQRIFKYLNVKNTAFKTQKSHSKKIYTFIRKNLAYTKKKSYLCTNLDHTKPTV